MDSRNCLICTVPITEKHLGIAACRACAAFFKRAEIAGKRFICRQGEGKCVFIKHEKFMCRSCRYAKCVEVGMRYVLPVKKNPRLLQGYHMDALGNLCPETPSTSSSSTSTTPGPARESLIDRFGNEYKASIDRRLVLEKEYVAKHNLPRYDYPNEDFYLANFTALYELYRVAIKESVTLPQKIFDNFEELAIDHRVILFKNFVNNFAMIECLYYSMKYFKDDSNMFMSSLITVADSSKTEDWMTNDGIEKNLVKREAFKSTVKGYTNGYLDLLVPMAKMGELTERELHALAVLIFCDVGEKHLPICPMKSSHMLEQHARVYLRSYKTTTEITSNCMTFQSGSET